MSERKFHKTVIMVTVLSEGPFLYDDLDDVHYAINEDCVGKVEELCRTEITEEQMIVELVDAGSEPEFFRIGERKEE
jgi:hypothetical protein